MKPLVLVVEDDASIRESLRDLLDDEGYRVAEATNGVEALERLAAEVPALILLDLWMPVMTGGQLLVEMRARAGWASIPVVVLTAAVNEGDAGGATVLRKPVRLELLLETVVEKLRR